MRSSRSSETSRGRQRAVYGLIFGLLLTCLLSCKIRDTTTHPTFPDGGMLKGSTPLSDKALARLGGVYKVSANAGRFGTDVVVHPTRTTLSVLAADNAAYAIMQAGCIENGSRIVLEGAWRYGSTFDTGLIRLFVGPDSVVKALCAPTVPDTFSEKPSLGGLVGVNAANPGEPTSFAYDHPSKVGSGRFVVAGHHGACATTDDCGASENSVESVKMAESFGASVVSLDVQMTQDGVPVLFHDDNLGPRLNSGPYCHGAIADYPLANLRASCKLRFGEQIPTLDDALDAVVNDTLLNGVWLDIKTAYAVQPSIEAMVKWNKIAAAKGRRVKLVIGLAEQDILEAYQQFTPKPEGILCLIELETTDVEQTPCDVWGPRFTRGPMAGDVARLQAEKKTVVFWTMDEQDFIDLFLTTAKPNGILSDRPGLVEQRFQLIGTLPDERAAL